MRMLCFGDSNTYGYDPRSYLGGRYGAEVRWVDRLAEQRGWELLNAGQNGREIPRRSGEMRRFQQLLAQSQPLDLLVVMLGSNDLLQGNTPEMVSARMETFLRQLPMEPREVVLMAPPPMKTGTWVTEERLLGDSVELSRRYQTLARTLGTRFVDTREWDIDLTFDGVHFSEAGHKTFAEQLGLALAAFL